MFAVEWVEVEISKGGGVEPLATLFDAKGPLLIRIVTDDTLDNTQVAMTCYLINHCEKKNI